MAQRVDNGRVPLDDLARRTTRLLFLAWLIDYADRYLINLALPLIGRDFNLDHTHQGLLLSAFVFSYALCQLPGGFLADRFGAVRVMLVAVAAWSLFTAATGLVGTFALLLAVRLLFGVAQGIFPGASAKALTERVELEQRMTASGWIQSAGAASILLAPALAAPAISLWGWQTAFVGVASLGVLVFVLLWRFLPAPRQQLAATERPRPGEVRAVLSAPALWCFALMFFGYNVVMIGAVSWIPAYLQTERGLSVAQAGLVSALPAVLAGLATVLGGRLADRLGGRHRGIVLPALLTSAVFLVVMAFAGSTLWFMVTLSVATVVAAVCYMPILSVPLGALPSRLTGSGMGLVFLGGQAAGVVTPLVFGALVDAYSYQVAFLCLAVGAVIGALMSLTTPQTPEEFRRRVPIGSAEPMKS